MRANRLSRRWVRVRAPLLRFAHSWFCHKGLIAIGQFRLRLAQRWQAHHRPRCRDTGPYFPFHAPANTVLAWPAARKPAAEAHGWNGLWTGYDMGAEPGLEELERALARATAGSGFNLKLGTWTLKLIPNLKLET